ncbi:hypothetical protein COTS27_01559 [Spirochaetota bacterium]|nr:hypothetical protein COTS27_01559 [Spirochaetota bacterium]
MPPQKKISSKRILTLLGFFLWVVLFFLPLAASIIVTILPSIGYEPALAQYDVSFRYWQQFLLDPLFHKSILKTIIIGYTSAITALIGAFGIAALFYKYTRHLIKWLAGMLAIPHAAFALGVSFLLAPAGYFVRILESLGLSNISGNHNPFLLFDHLGLSLFTVLVLKEIPFLTYIILGSMKNHEIENWLITTRSLGYTNFAAWRKVIIPVVYKRIRLAFFIVLAYSLSVVDMSIILGPQQPPTLSVLLVQFYSSDITEMRFIAYAGALFLGFLIGVSILSFWVIEKLLSLRYVLSLRYAKVFSFITSAGIMQGRRTHWLDSLFKWNSWLIVFLLAFITTLAIFVNAVWSFAERWRYPALLPSSYTTKYWNRALLPDFEPSNLLSFTQYLNKDTLELIFNAPLFQTLCIGCLSTLAAFIVSIVFLEAVRLFKNNNLFIKGLYSSFFIPLIIPETILLFGITFLAIYMSFNANILTLSWTHFLYTFPYMMLTLYGPYKSYDERYSIIGRTLAKQKLKTFLKIKLPLLIRTIAIALAIAFSVSVTQYLSTELIGGGRIITITTEAVNLSVSLNRRIMGVYAIIQMAIPMTAFLIVFYAFKPLEHSQKP